MNDKNDKIDLTNFESKIKTAMDDENDIFSKCLTEGKVKEACEILEQKLEFILALFEDNFDESYISSRISMVYNVKLAALLVTVTYCTTLLGGNYGLVATGLIDTMRDLMLLLADPFSYTNKEKKDPAKAILDNFLHSIKSNIIN